MFVVGVLRMHARGNAIRSFEMGNKFWRRFFEVNSGIFVDLGGGYSLMKEDQVFSLESVSFQDDFLDESIEFFTSLFPRINIV